VCKKLLQGLFGGGAAPAAAPAKAEANYSGGKEAAVKETSTALTVGDRVTGSGVNAGPVDNKRKKGGVPGLVL
jgi:hypothetical protein